MAVKLNQADLQFILEQIKISEAHAAGADLADLIPDPHVPWGLRTVDGTYNNFIEGRETWGSSGQVMPRLLEPTTQLDDGDGDVMPLGGGATVTNTDYGVIGQPGGGNGGHSGNVADADPRLISNLVADMGFTNPAAIVAALTFAGSENIYGATGDLAIVQNAYQTMIDALAAADDAGDEAAAEAARAAFDAVLADKGIERSGNSVVIPNVAADEGLSAPFSSWMTYFGQFFDHGLDLISKGGNGTIYVPLAADDPLITHGADGVIGTGDELSPQQAFMVVTRATPVGGENEARNTTTPFVDQNQTYTSHASHQVFLREYTFDEDGQPVSTGRLLNGVNGGLPTWGDVKAQAKAMLGIELTDVDVTAVPLLRTDPYGRLILDEVTGFAQVVVGLGPDGVPNTADDITISGTPASPVSLTTAIRTHSAFLDDIAHNAVPGTVYDADGNPQTTGTLVVEADSDDVAGNAIGTDFRGRKVAYDDELLDAHFVTGDGRGNENIGLTAVHHIFHSEHNRQVEDQKLTILNSGDLNFINEWLLTDLTELPTLPATALEQLEFAAGLNWDGERLFQAGRFATEMQYQHLVFEEFARKVQPAIDPFVFNSITDVDPSIFAEFAHTVYRFGHSMLTETIPMVDGNGNVTEMGLIEAFLNPIAFDENSTITHEEAAGAIIHGLSMQRGNEIDEFVTGALRNNLLGLPLDLAAINIARGRDTAMPKLNEAREQLYAASGSTFLEPYESWVDFAANLKNPISIVNFIAAYGDHPTLENGTAADKRAAAWNLVFGTANETPEQASARRVWLNGPAEETGLNTVDLWIGGLAEKKMPFGGMLGSTFNAVFELQMENLQDGDRFYYLTRTQGQNFLNELEQNSFSKMILANTSLSDPGADGIRGTSDDIVSRHIGIDVFARYDHYLEIDKTMQLEEDPTGNDPVLEGMGRPKVDRDNPDTAIDESATDFYNTVEALLKQYDANGQSTGQLEPGSTWADLKANAANVGVTLIDADVLNAPILRVDDDGNPLFVKQPTDVPVNLGGGSFEDGALVAGEPGVIEDGLGNYTIGAPSGWVLSGTGGLYAPVETIVAAEGHQGTNVAWLTGGAMLSRDTGHSLVQGVSYNVRVNYAERTDQGDADGVMRLIATQGGQSVVLSSVDMPNPVDGTWQLVSFSTAFPAQYAGWQIRIEIENTGPGAQILIDDVAIEPLPPVVYRSDQNANSIVGYNPTHDPFVRDGAGNVVRGGEPLISPLPAAANPAHSSFDPAVLNGQEVDVVGLLADAETAGLVGNYIRFTGGEHVSVGGTAGNDTIIMDFGDDSIWGDAGDDRIEGGAGVDLINGGSGDDIITDSGDSFDFIKGEDGNDVIANSNGTDIVMGGRGKDVIYAGVDFTEVFGGEGDDFIMGGDDMDFLMGNEGDDWIEGGGGFDTTAGDNSELFFDSRILGHDVMFAGNDEHDFDAESGDDIMVQGESVMRNEGMFGFDWVSFQGMQLDAYADMRIRIFTTEQQDILRNRFDKVEALSGWDRNDTLIGDERTAADAAEEPEIGGDTVGANEGIFFNDGLSQAGVDRIDGLRSFLGDLIADRPDGLTADQLEALIAFDQGNIILGGRGSDRLQGNGGNDVIDGDRYLNVRISITDGPDGPEIGTVTTLKHVFTAADEVPGSWIGKSLFQLLIDRVVSPTEMHIVREILDGNDGGFDTAVFRGAMSEYTIEGAGLANPNNLAFWDVDGDGFIKVTHLDPGEADGVTLGFDGEDYLKNVERLEFADRSLNQVAGSNDAPTGDILIQVTRPNGNVVNQPRPSVGDVLSVAVANLVDPDSVTPTNPTGAIAASDLDIVWEVEEEFGTGVFILAGEGATLSVTPLMVGLQIRAVARFRDGDGVLETVISTPTEIVANNVTPVGTPGPDLLFGTNGADVIDGLAGDDEIFGLRGDDRIIGGPGNDILDGGAGQDTAVFEGAIGDYTVEFDEFGDMEIVHTATGVEDLVRNFEFFEFAGQTFTAAQVASLGAIIGNNQGNVLNGTADDDVIFGRNGNDTLNGLGGDDILFGEADNDTLNGDGGADILEGGDGDDTLNGGAGADTLNGGIGNDVLNGDGGADILTGGAGNDTIDGGAGNDTIIWAAGDGRDIIDGGANGAAGDTFQIDGDASTENFIIWSRQNAIDAGITDIVAATEIVVTRNGTVIAELAGIEEIVINANGGGGTVTIEGNFDASNLAQNTITINGSTGDDEIDISGLTSSHRVVFKSLGGNDTIVGTLRPQDVIELAPGTTIDDYTQESEGGIVTLTNGSNTISFSAAGSPTFAAPGTGGVGGGSSSFQLTAADLAGQKALVNGQPLDGDDGDEVPTGVRTLSGADNNEDNAGWGSADTPFIRLTDARYGELDGNGNRAINPIFQGLDSRTISNILGDQEDNLPMAPNDANILFMAFGQYFDHGLDFLPKGGNGTIAIGAPGTSPGGGNPADLTRGTVHSYDEDGNPQHLNKTSAYVDQNQAYGSNALVGQFLRQGDGDGGLSSYLLKGADDPSNPDFSLLPTLRETILHHWENDTIFQTPSGAVSFRDYFTDYELPNGDVRTLYNAATGAFDAAVVKDMAGNFMGSGHAILLDTNPYINLLDHYVAGDGRANENFALTSMHTIWARNHNWHVENLVAAGFEGTEEELFQAAKMINEAEYQRVVFDEFADALLGGMKGSGTHGHDEYNPDASAGISHEFAAAVYRFGHSLIGETMTVLDADGNPQQVRLFDAFLNPTNDASAFTAPLPTLAQYGYIPQPGFEQYGVNAILGGSIQQPAEGVDFNIVDAVRNDLTRVSADLFAFNVARGWDVGLGTLNQIRMDLAKSTDPYIREALEHVDDMTAYTSWEDFQDRNGLSDTVIAQLKQAYPDLIIAAADIAAFQAVNPDITLHALGDGRMRVNGIDRLDLWVGGLAEAHVNGGMVGSTFWVVLHEQFDRLQEADRFYYSDRFDNFDFYEAFIDGQNFADIVARNTGMENLPEDIFEVDDEDDNNNDNDGDDDTDEDDDDNGGVADGDDDDTDSDGDDDSDDDDSDEDDDDDSDEDDDQDSDEDEDDDDSDDDTDCGCDEDEEDDEDGGVTPTPPPSGGGTAIAGIIAGTVAGDILIGTASAETILGLAGSDNLFGMGGDDTIRGEDGDDFLSGGDGRDKLMGHAGDDELFGGGDRDTLFGGAGNDLLYGDEGDDVLEGGAGNDQVFGGAGNDLVLALVDDGNDSYWGEDGIDTLDYAAINQSMTVDLGNGLMERGSVAIAGGATYTIYGFENFIGGSKADVITASEAVNVIDGGGGDDIFRFESAAQADGDTIVNFRPGDRIDVSGIDGNTAASGKQGLSLVAGTSFSAAGQVTIEHQTRADGEYTVVRGNLDANGDAEFEIGLKGRIDLTADDFIGLN